jgi:hypothetical protein
MSFTASVQLPLAVVGSRGAGSFETDDFEVTLRDSG